MATKPLGTLQVVIAATADKLTAGLSAAKRSLQSFDNAITASVGKFGALTAALGGGISVAGITALTKAQSEVIDSAAKMSDRLGIATESLIGLQHAGNLAGADTELMNKSLEKMAKNVAIAATAGGPAADAFKAIGLDAEKLSGQNIDQTFLQIADGIKSIENPYQRAKVAAEIFGKAGGDLLPTLMAGSEAIKEVAAETEKYGTAVNRVDASKVEEANDNLTRVGEVIKGIGAQLAVALAPYISAAAKAFVDLATAGGGVGPKVSAAVEWVAKGVAYAADVVDSLGIAFLYAQKTALSALGGLSEYLAGWVKSAEGLFSKLGINIGDGMSETLKAFGEELNRQSQEIDGKLTERLVGKSAGEKVDAFFKDIEKKAQDSANKVGDNAKAASKASPEFARQDALRKKEEEDRKKKEDAAKKQQEDMAKRAQAITEELKTPFEKYVEKIAEIQKLQKAGLLTAEQAGAATANAKGEFSKSLETPDRSPIGAIEAGSREAYSAIREAQDSANGRRSTEEKMLEYDREANRLLAEIAKKEQRFEVANF